jgi:hypothetical protein
MEIFEVLYSIFIMNRADATNYDYTKCRSIDFLREAQLKLKSKRWLLRVPLYERDWRVPLMEELGVDYRLDSTHCTEYTQESFAKEMGQAGVEIVYKEIRWGEIWCEAKLKKGEESDAILRSDQ